MLSRLNAKVKEQEEERDRGEMGCQFAAGKNKKNFVREANEPYMNCEELTTI